jgi:DNA-binding SARP family transcriptional activator
MSSKTRPSLRDSVPAGQLGKLRLLGQPSLISLSGVAIALSEKDSALLAYLVLQPEASASDLRALLWPEAKDAANSMTQRIHRLSTKARCPVIVRYPTLCVAPGWKVDVLNDLVLLETDPNALDGELLGNYDYSTICEDAASWVTTQRHAWREKLFYALLRRAELLVKRGEARLALPIAARLVRLQPLHEAAHRALMQAHYLAGDRAAAIEAYDHCEAVLRRELNTPPHQETLALLKAIESMQVTGSRANRSTLALTLNRPPRLIGRRSELALIEAAWREGKHFVLVGEAGIGKSRLLHEVCNAIGADMMSCRAVPGDGDRPYALVSRVVRAIATPALIAALPDQARLPLVGLIDVGADAMESDMQRLSLGQLRSAVLALLASARGGALANAGEVLEGSRSLVIDDLHFADASSCELLHTLIPEVAPLGWRWAIAHRQTDAMALNLSWLAALVEQSHAVTAALRPLDREEVEELVRSVTPEESFVVADAEALYRTCGGNPLFILETIRSRGQLHSIAPDRRPGCVDVLLDERVAMLTSPALELAQVAFIAGAQMSAELAAAVTERSPMALAQPWLELERAHVLSAESFTHDLMRDAVGRTLVDPIRRVLSRRVAAWLQAHGGASSSVAELWWSAAQWPDAARCWERAAEEAMRLGRLAVQVGFLERAAGAWDRCEDKVHRNRMWALMLESLEELGRYALERELAQRLLDNATGLRDRAEATAALARLRYKDVADEQTLELARSAKGYALSLGDRALHEKAIALEAETYCWMGRPGDGQNTLRPIAEAALSRVPDLDSLSVVLSYVQVLHMANEDAEALRILQHVNASAASAPPLKWRLWALMAEADICNGMAELERAEHCLRQLRDLKLDASGNANGVTPEDALLADRLVSLGRFADAISLSENSLRSYELDGDSWLADCARYCIARAYVSLGQTGRARLELARLRNESTAMQMRCEFAHALAAEADGRPALEHFERAYAHSLNSEAHVSAVFQARMLPHLPPGEASVLADRLWSTFKDGGRRGTVLTVKVCVTEALRRIGRVDEAASHAAQLLEHYGDPSIRSSAVAWTWWLIYLSLRDAGRVPAAERALRQGVVWIDNVVRHTPLAYRRSLVADHAIHRQLMREAAQARVSPG